ncbi:MAG: exosortase, partial [Gammaproteobacteria bacterium]
MPAWVLTVLLLAVMLVEYRKTAASLVEIWSRSGTFSHGFLIVPITLVLLWKRREALSQVPIRPAPWSGAGLIAAAGFLWYLSLEVGALIGAQLALVIMVPGIVAAVWGWPTVRAAAFPLAYLVFAVPMGESLVPPLMDFTANFTVTALQLTGIPVYQEGTYFELPTG